MSMGKTQSYTVAVRWAAWSPFSNFSQSEHSVQMFGGPTINPDSMFFFKTVNIEGSTSTESLGLLAAGSVNFNFQLLKKVFIACLCLFFSYSKKV